MLPIILTIVAVVIGAFLIIVALQPAEYRVERSATMAAAPTQIFEQVNDFHNWGGWNPWGKLDPAMRVTYEGAPAGVGSVYKWLGNKNVGEGKMTITQSRPAELVGIRLDFYKPFKATSDTEFSFQPQSDGKTVVTWRMNGRNNFIAKAMHMICNMDKMIGSQFEKGLSDMKQIVERRGVAGAVAANSNN
jgi:hypothetical protein